jgi:hypothetical protein
MLLEKRLPCPPNLSRDPAHLPRCHVERIWSRHLVVEARDLLGVLWMAVESQTSGRRCRGQTRGKGGRARMRCIRGCSVQGKVGGAWYEIEV